MRINIGGGILFAAILILLGSAFQLGIDRSEIVECTGWRAEAMDRVAYSERNPGGYYITGWQKEQCDRWGIKIDAPTK